MIAFALAVFFMISTPGPAVLALAGVGATFSFRDGINFLIGLTIGYLKVWLLIVTGLASVFFSYFYIRVIFAAISSLYLVYLASKICFSGSKIAFTDSYRIPSIKDGIILQIVNPKAYAFHSILLSGFSIFPNNLLIEIFIKFIIMNLIWLPLHLAWLFIGSSFKKINLKPKFRNYINLFMGCSLIVVSILSFLSIYDMKH